MTSGPGLQWLRGIGGWRLFRGRTCVGRVIPDAKHPSMWRSIMPDGRLSDMASLSWARNAVLVSAEREIEYAVEACKSTLVFPGKRGCFSAGAAAQRFCGRGRYPSSPSSLIGA